MVVFHLLLAHVLGDFVFQSNDLIKRKYKSWVGTFEHVCIVTFFTALLSFPFLNEFRAWAVIVTIFVIHFLQDLTKIKFDLIFKIGKKSVLPFFADQILHTALIVYLAPRLDTLTPTVFPDWLMNIYFSPFLITYLLGLALFSYAYDLTLYQFKRKQAKNELFYTPNFTGMKKRITIFSFVAIVLLALYRLFM